MTVYTSRLSGKPVTIIEYVVAQWAGRLRIVAVDFRSKWKSHGWPDCNPAADKVVVDKDRVIRHFRTEAAARRALDAGNAHWPVDRALAYDAIRREPDE